MTDTSGIEFPDEAGYPDGTGTLDEGTGAFTDAAADAEAADIDEFADQDIEDVDGD